MRIKEDVQMIYTERRAVSLRISWRRL